MSVLDKDWEWLGYEKQGRQFSVLAKDEWDWIGIKIGDSLTSSRRLLEPRIGKDSLTSSRRSERGIKHFAGWLNWRLELRLGSQTLAIINSEIFFKTESTACADGAWQPEETGLNRLESAADDLQIGRRQ
ncbi:hypothetical protein H4Q26_001752 [Puccinia striiformis f. sp. tritici PST-130]|nr:hypothetical protein H4Q26_001752 [Puccinia striiformis f. sp. tritici PST-130]